MKKLLLIIPFLVTILLLVNCRPSDTTIQKEVDSLIAKWRPDKREAIFEVTIQLISSDQVLVKGETTIPDAKDDLLQFLRQKGYKVKEELTLLPDSLIKEKPWALINLSAAQLRSKPSNSSELVSQAILGTPVKILKKGGGWYLIQTPDNYISWIKKASLSFLTTQEWETWKQSERLVFKERDGTIFNEKNEEVSDIVLGGIVQKINKKGRLVKIALPNGETGYLKASELVNFSEWEKDTTFIAEEIIEDGKDLMGLPYLWGGTSSKGVDCSGFMKTIFFENGVVLARDASQQIRYGDSVSLADNFSHLEKGDLLFFGYKDPYRVTHVAMYIGDMEYIQAAGRVKINSLDSTRENFSDFRIPMLLGARRYIGQKSQKGILFVKNHPWY